MLLLYVSVIHNRYIITYTFYSTLILLKVFHLLDIELIYTMALMQDDCLTYSEIYDLNMSNPNDDSSNFTNSESNNGSEPNMPNNNGGGDEAAAGAAVLASESNNNQGDSDNMSEDDPNEDNMSQGDLSEDEELSEARMEQLAEFIDDLGHVLNRDNPEEYLSDVGNIESYKISNYNLEMALEIADRFDNNEPLTSDEQTFIGNVYHNHIDNYDDEKSFVENIESEMEDNYERIRVLEDRVRDRLLDENNDE